jgi:amidophosphoribosyltransferase
VGHLRYSTAGASLLRNCQPFLVRFGDMQLAIAHNGNLVNALELRRELESTGSIFQTTIDSEVFVHLIAKYINGGTLEEAVIKACARVRGAYSLIILANNKMIALRDPNGVRPLMLGRLGDHYVLASETCAFDLLEAEIIRPIEPGEMLVLQDKCMQSFRLGETQPTRQCIFELIYFARPDSEVIGEVVYLRRKQMGIALAREAPVDADYVMPFPDSGVYAAIGYSQASGLRFEMSMVRNHYVGRTFIQPSQDMRDFSVRVKLNPVRQIKRTSASSSSRIPSCAGTTIRTR